MTNQPKCEHCGHMFDAAKTVNGPVICPACGLTAHPFTANPAPSAKTTGKGMLMPLVMAALIIAILITQILVIIQTRQARKDMGDLTAALARIEADVEILQSAPLPEPISNQEQSSFDNELENEQDEPEVPASVMTAEEQMLYQRLAARLARKLPIAEINDDIKLRLRSGQLQRGRLVGVKDGFVLLLQNGEIQDINVSQLDRESRMKVDPLYREKAIRYQMNRRKRE